MTVARRAVYDGRVSSRAIVVRAVLFAAVLLAGSALPVDAVADAPGWTWSAPAAIGTGTPYVSVAAVGAQSATSLIVGAHDDSIADAWIERGGETSWSALTAPPSWAIPPYDPATGLLTPGSGYGCAAPALAAAADGTIVAVCIAGDYLGPGPYLTAAQLASGSTALSPMAVDLFVGAVPVAPSLAIAGDGTLVARLAEVDGSGHGECGGLAWQGSTLDASTWLPLPAVEGLGMSVAAGADGSAVVAGVRCVYNAMPSGLPRLVASARRGGDGRWTFTNIARKVGVPSFAAVAPNGRMAVAWAAGEGQSRWASIGTAIRPAGAVHWACRPLVGQAACASGVSHLRPRDVAAASRVHLARIYALVALPDDAFLLLFSGLVGKPAHRGGLFSTVLEPGTRTWSQPKAVDPQLDEDSFALGDGPAAVAIDEQGGLLAAWPHKNGPGSHSLRIARLAGSDSVFVRETDLTGVGFPFQYRLIAPPDGPPSVVWIDETTGAGDPSGRLLVASATA
jgi:hypothetical protein